MFGAVGAVSAAVSAAQWRNLTSATSTTLSAGMTGTTTLSDSSFYSSYGILVAITERINALTEEQQVELVTLVPQLFYCIIKPTKRLTDLNLLLNVL